MKVMADEGAEEEDESARPGDGSEHASEGAGAGRPAPESGYGIGSSIGGSRDECGGDVVDFEEGGFDAVEGVGEQPDQEGF